MTIWEERASEWREANPAAWEWMVHRLSRKLARGQHDSMRHLVETIRYDRPVVVTDRQFRVNNNIVRPLADMMLGEHPEFAGVLEVRH